MLKRTHRFHGHNSLQSVYSRGTSVRGQYFSFKFAQRRSGELRAAVVVSTKVSKKAPVRNRIRRRVYELIRTSIDPTQPIDLVVTVYADVVALLPSAEIRGQFEGLCDQAHIPVRSDKTQPALQDE